MSRLISALMHSVLSILSFLTGVLVHRPRPLTENVTTRCPHCGGSDGARDGMSCHDCPSNPYPEGLWPFDSPPTDAEKEAYEDGRWECIRTPDPEPCGYCGDANDPEVICQHCWDAMPNEQSYKLARWDRLTRDMQQAYDIAVWPYIYLFWRPDHHLTIVYGDDEQDILTRLSELYLEHYGKPVNEHTQRVGPLSGLRAYKRLNTTKFEDVLEAVQHSDLIERDPPITIGEAFSFLNERS